MTTQGVTNPVTSATQDTPIQTGGALKYFEENKASLIASVGAVAAAALGAVAYAMGYLDVAIAAVTPAFTFVASSLQAGVALACANPLAALAVSAVVIGGVMVGVFACTQAKAKEVPADDQPAKTPHQLPPQDFKEV